MRIVYETAHDFDVICQYFPNKSRENIAFKLKCFIAFQNSQVLPGDSPISTNLPHPSSFSFLSDPTNVKSSIVNTAISISGPFAKLGSPYSRDRKDVNLGGTENQMLSSDNPMFSNSIQPIHMAENV